MGSFANCHILAWALSRSRISGIWLFLCLDCVSINAYTKTLSKCPIWLKIYGDFHNFTLYLLRHYLGERTMTFRKHTVYILSVSISMPKIIKRFKYLSVCQLFKRNDHFRLLTTDGRTTIQDDYMTLLESQPTSVGRPFLLIVQFSNPVAETISFSKISGPSCSKLKTSLVNDSLKFTSSDTQMC